MDITALINTKPTGVIRIIGLDEAGQVLSLLRTALASPDTAYLPDGFKNPAPDELDDLAAVTNHMPPYNIAAARKHIIRYMPGMGNIDLPNAVWTVLEDLRKTAPGTVYTAYVKILYWLKTAMTPAFQKDVTNPCVIVSGPVSKHSLLAMQAAALSGVTVWYFDPVSDGYYRKADPRGNLTQLIDNPIKKPLDQPLILARNPWANTQASTAKPWENILIPPKDRPPGSSLAPAYIMGTGDRAEYRNLLYTLKTSLTDSGRHVLLITSPQAPPDNDEIALFRTECKDAYHGLNLLAKNISAKCPVSSDAQKALARAIASIQADTTRKAYNDAVRTACWFYRIISQHPDCIIRYGPLIPKEVKTFEALALADIDTIWFDPAAFGSPPGLLQASSWIVPEPMTPGECEPYPTAPERIRAETVAHAASKELDSLLYTDTGLYRDRQFQTIQSVTLKTTFDEVIQLWPEPPNVRPAFEASGNQAIIPCLFAKIAGVPNYDTKTYWNTVRNMMTDNAYVITSLPIMLNPKSLSNPLLENCTPEDIDRINNQPHAYLSENTRHWLFSAAATLCGPSTILLNRSDTTRSMIRQAVLDIPKPILDLLQAFDPAKSIPKILIISTATNTVAQYDSILLALLNLIGFDIAIFEPTGYQSIERYIRPEAYDLIQAGPYMPDIYLPNLRKNKSKFGNIIKNFLN